MLLNIENIQKHYGGVHALNDVSLSVERGTVLGLVGGNGAGKSTLMKCVTGAESADSGTIFFDGHILIQGDPHTSRLAGIEMIYQELNLCSQQNVISNIFLGREQVLKFLGVRTPLLHFGKMKRKAAALLSSLNTEIDVEKPAGKLSGGQQQAVAIARALLTEPKLLIMDEPTAALGLREAAKVLDLIRSLKKQQITIILVSHRLKDVFEVADQIVLMRHGAIKMNKLIDEVSLTEVSQNILEN